MNGWKCFVLALSGTALPAHAALAAAGDEQQAIGVMGTFAGARLSLPLGAAAPSERKARLGLGISRFHASFDSSGRKQERYLPGVELRLTGTGKARLMLGGQSKASIEQRLGISSSGAVAIVGGLAAAALVVASMSGGGDDDELDKKQCLLPEKELCS